MRLDDDIGLFLQGVDDELGQPVIHFLHFTVELVADEELLFTEGSSHNPNLQFFTATLYKDALAVLEGMQHGRIRKTHLPFVAQHHVLTLRRHLPSLLQHEFVRPAAVLVIPTAPLPLPQVFHNSGEVSTEEVFFLPSTDEILDEISRFWLRLWLILRQPEGVSTTAIAETLIIGEFKLSRGVVLNEGAGVISFSLFTPLPAVRMLESYVLLHTLDNLCA